MMPRWLLCPPPPLLLLCCAAETEPLLEALDEELDTDDEAAAPLDAELVIEFDELLAVAVEDEELL